MGAAIAFYCGRLFVPPSMGKPAQAGDSSTTATGTSTSVGRWGTLKAESLPLADGKLVFTDRSLRLQPVRWLFKDYTEAPLLEFLRGCELSSDQAKALLDTKQWKTEAEGIVIVPPDWLVMGLSPASREKIYWTLAASATNYPQFKPFNFPPGSFDERFAGSGLPGEKIALIRNLLYPGFGYNWLALDKPLLEAFAPAELEKVVRVLYNTPAWLVRLEVQPGENVEPLVQYWGEGRQNRLRPLFESLAKGPGPRVIGLTALLPGFAQDRLNTFPDAGPDASHEDCFYSSMNFFNEAPDSHFSDPAYTRKILDTDYSVIPPPANFGDIILVINSEGRAVHACVYVADEFVFTKNGGSLERPWVVMKMSDVLACFPSEKGRHLQFWRRKDLAVGMHGIARK